MKLYPKAFPFPAFLFFTPVFIEALGYSPRPCFAPVIAYANQLAPLSIYKVDTDTLVPFVVRVIIIYKGPVPQPDPFYAAVYSGKQFLRPSRRNYLKSSNGTLKVIFPIYHRISFIQRFTTPLGWVRFRIKRHPARRLTDPSKCSGFSGSRTTRVARGSLVSQFVRLGVQPPRWSWDGISVHPVPRQFRWNCRETGFQTNYDSYNFYRVIVSTRNEVLTISLFGEAPDEGGTTKE